MCWRAWIWPTFEAALHSADALAGVTSAQCAYGLAVVLDQHGVADIGADRVLDRLWIGLMAIAGGLDAATEAAVLAFSAYQSADRFRARPAPPNFPSWPPRRLDSACPRFPRRWRSGSHSRPSRSCRRGAAGLVVFRHDYISREIQ
jgi:hypothetical protein